MQIHWFPGHMAKTRRLIEEQLKLVDVVIELVDARIPQSSKNPLLDELIANKPRLIVLNKEDLADDNVTGNWIKYIDNFNNLKAIKFNATEAKAASFKAIKEELYNLTREKREARLKKGIKKQVIRCMVVGIPNVGKSTFINIIVGKKTAKTGNKPGITRGKQWIRLGGNIELLDVPGILWPKFENPEVGFMLAATGAVKDEVFDFGEVAIKFLEILKIDYPELLIERYGLEEDDLQKDKIGLLEEIAKKRGCILAGKRIDYERIAKLIINEFRNGKIGRISLEKPEPNYKG